MPYAQVTKVSYWFIAATLLLVGLLHMATPFITILFASLVLRIMPLPGRRWLAIGLFLVLVALIFYGFIFFVREAITALPKIVETSIPLINRYATEHGVDIGFSDVDGLRARLVEGITDELRGVAKFAEIATKEFVFLIIGLIVAVSIFLSGKLDLGSDQHAIKNNLYAALCSEISKRFVILYQSFSTVMGAQLIISAINTVFTGIFVHVIDLPYANVAVALTFLCGLFPIIGNVISNTLIVCIALTVSPHLAMWALAFLIALHKLEYFLNSKIIGGRIRNPMWLTMMGLVVGERMMGVPGMILAPVILHYIKLESVKIEVKIS